MSFWVGERFYTMKNNGQLALFIQGFYIPSCIHVHSPFSLLAYITEGPFLLVVPDYNLPLLPSGFPSGNWLFSYEAFPSLTAFDPMHPPSSLLVYITGGPFPPPHTRLQPSFVAFRIPSPTLRAHLRWEQVPPIRCSLRDLAQHSGTIRFWGASSRDCSPRIVSSPPAHVPSSTPWTTPHRRCTTTPFSSYSCTIPA